MASRLWDFASSAAAGSSTTSGRHQKQSSAQHQTPLSKEEKEVVETLTDIKDAYKASLLEHRQKVCKFSIFWGMGVIITTESSNISIKSIKYTIITILTEFSLFQFFKNFTIWRFFWHKRISPFLGLKY